MGALPGVSPLSLFLALHLLVLLLSGNGWGVQAALAPLNTLDTVYVLSAFKPPGVAEYG